MSKNENEIINIKNAVFSPMIPSKSDNVETEQDLAFEPFTVEDGECQKK